MSILVVSYYRIARIVNCSVSKRGGASCTFAAESAFGPQQNAAANQMASASGSGNDIPRVWVKHRQRCNPCGGGIESGEDRNGHLPTAKNWLF